VGTPTTEKNYTSSFSIFRTPNSGGTNHGEKNTSGRWGHQPRTNSRPAILIRQTIYSVLGWWGTRTTDRQRTQVVGGDTNHGQMTC
jgi:hypothetical protein